ncbi:MAG: glycosyltransferase [Bradymonadia bacterium]
MIGQMLGRLGRRDQPIGVMHVVHTLNVGGAEKLVHDLALAVDRQRFRPVVACLDEGGALEAGLKAEGIPVEILHRAPGLRPDVVGRLAAACVKHRIDVIHAHQYTPFFYGLLAGRLAGWKRCLLTEHGRHFPDVRKPKRVAANQLLWRLNGATVAVSEFTRQALIDNDGFPPHHVRVLYNGIDTRRFDDLPPRDDIRASLGVTPDTPVVGICARMSPEKNLPLLVDAFARLRQVQPEAVLLLAGDGPARADVEQRASALDLGDAVRFLGFRKDVPALVTAYDVFALSSLTEGTSVTLLEAMYGRCPVVATAVGGNPEIVADGETGVLVPSEDVETFAGALVHMFEDRDEALRMGVRGRARVQAHFTFDGMVKAYEDLYTDLA